MKYLWILLTMTMSLSIMAQQDTFNWKGTFVQDDDFIRMYYSDYNPKLGKIHASTCLYEISISNQEATIKVLDTFRTTISRKGILTYSSKDLKVITSFDTVFQCTYLYSLYIPQKFGVMFWTRASIVGLQNVIAEIYPLKLLTDY